MSEAIFCKTVAELSIAIPDAFNDPKQRIFPALLLLYSSMDVIASLSRPVAQEDTSGETFKAWIDTYMLPGSDLECTATEIWAARCGMLHTLSIESRLSRLGRARQICYVDRRSAVAKLQQRINTAGKQLVVVPFRHYARSFLEGVFKFAKRVEKDPELQSVVYHHVGKLAVQINLKVPT